MVSALKLFDEIPVSGTIQMKIILSCGGTSCCTVFSILWLKPVSLFSVLYCMVLLVSCCFNLNFDHSLLYNSTPFTYNFLLAHPR